jgi:predicted PurR-regulated permease PerM
MNSNADRFRFSSVVGLLVLGAALLVLIQAFTTLAPLILALLLTLLISLALNPVVLWLRKLTGGRKLATGLVTLSLIAIVGLTSWAFVGPLTGSISQLMEVLPKYWERFQKPLIRLENVAERSEIRLQAEVIRESNAQGETLPATSIESQIARNTQETTSTGGAGIRGNMKDMLLSLLGGIASRAFDGAQMLVVLITVFFSVLFTLLSPRPVISVLFQVVPERHHAQTLVIAQRIARFAPAWGGATLASMSTIGTLVFLLMWPILGLSDAMVLGLIAGVFEAIPFLGPTFATVPALLLAIGKGGMTPLWVLLAYILVQALENNVILPLIMSRGMKLHAVAVIFSMLLCIAAFGALGVLIAAPLASIVKIIHEELFRKRYLPSTTDSDLDRLARQALNEC